MKAVISCSIRGAITRFAPRHTTPSVVAARCMSVSTDPHQIAFTKPVVSIDRKTKIVCTVGPATDSKPMIMSLLQAGMNVMRLNCSHGNEAYYRDVIGKLRTCLKEVRKESAVHGVDFSDGAREDVCAIALDTKGPEIRTGSYSSSMGREISIEAGAKITFSTNEEVKDNQSETCLYIDYPNIVNVLKVGSPIFVDDGLLRLQVESIDKESGLLNCLAKNSALLGEKKGVNLPGAKVTLPAVSEKDKLDIELAKTLGVDFIFASFVRKASHIAEIRKIVGDSISIIAKIENEEGLRNVESIIDAADGVMVARGDLGIEIPIQNVFLAQKRIMSLCNAKGKPVICATQMLESMVKSPRPTRAECSDVANAVLDGADCVMLSGETAKGLYPIEAVKLMSTICKTAECVIDYRQTCDDMRHRTKSPNQTSEALVLSAVVASFDEQAKVIIILGNTGHTAVLAAKYRPAAPIICVTSNSRTARRLQTARGVHAVVVPAGMVGSADMTTAAFKAALQMKVCKAGDRVVVIYSEFKGVTSTEATANVMKLTSVPTWMDDSTYLDE